MHILLIDDNECVKRMQKHIETYRSNSHDHETGRMITETQQLQAEQQRMMEALMKQLEEDEDDEKKYDHEVIEKQKDQDKDCSVFVSAEHFVDASAPKEKYIYISEE